MTSSTTATSDVFITGPQLRKRFQRSGQTIWRWMKNPNFPKASKLNGRLYFNLAQIEKWEREEAANSACARLASATAAPNESMASHARV